MAHEDTHEVTQMELVVIVRAASYSQASTEGWIDDGRRDNPILLDTKHIAHYTHTHTNTQKKTLVTLPFFWHIRLHLMTTD